MRYALHLVLILTLAAGITAPLTGQETPASTATETASGSDPAQPDAATTAAAPQDAPDMSSHAVRERFSEILRNHPRELGTILALDPTLLSNDAFLAGYPAIAAFVAEYPQVRRNPNFYLHEYTRRQSSVDDVTEPFVILAVFAVIAFALSWLVRTMIEQKRWNRLSKIQTEVHNKILDRFGTSAELLEYIKTPAGSKFLESAPIPLHAEQPARVAQPRALWSIQAGIVIAAGAIGMLLVSARLTGDGAEGMFGLGMIALSIGLGFVASAAVSMVLSKRLGAQDDPAQRPDLVR